MAWKKIFLGIGLWFFALAGGLFVRAGENAVTWLAGWEMKLRVFEGLKEGSAEGARVVTSSYLRYMIIADMPSEGEKADVQDQIKRIFNLKDVKLLTEADLAWQKGRPEKMSHVFRPNGHDYMIQISMADKTGLQPFQIDVTEQRESGAVSLLNTRFGIPENKKNTIIFGFEDMQGKPYFLSMRFINLFTDARSSDAVIQGKMFFKAPRLIKRVDPVYPEAAVQKKIEGTVIIEATMDKHGEVIDAKVIKSIPELDQAAVEAVKQWVYEPVLIEGTPAPVSFTVTVKFGLDKDKAADEAGHAGGVTGGVIDPEREKKIIEFEKDAVRCVGNLEPPKLIKEVAPVYPENARKTGIQGVVILSVKTGENGRVIDAMALRSIPELDQAAVDAVKQWVYEPVLINGKPKKVVFTVTVSFQLK